MGDADGAVRRPGEQLDAVGALAEPTRRAIYDQVARRGDWVTRDDVASAVGLARATVAHHLDRLEDAGLLEVRFRRLSGRTGPGAGRPSKLYRRASQDFDVTLPPRDYALAGRLLARAVESARSGRADVSSALRQESAAEGEAMAEEMRTLLEGDDAAGDDDPERRLAAALTVLARHGYEPDRRDAHTVVLRNCPFHRLVLEHAALVCEMNERLLQSALESFGGHGYAARFEPDERLCCVRLRSSA